MQLASFELRLDHAADLGERVRTRRAGRDHLEDRRLVAQARLRGAQCSLRFDPIGDDPRDDHEPLDRGVFVQVVCDDLEVLDGAGRRHDARGDRASRALTTRDGSEVLLDLLDVVLVEERERLTPELWNLEPAEATLPRGTRRRHESPCRGS